MELIDHELRRLNDRMHDLQTDVIPDLENRTQALYIHIMTLQKDSEERLRQEAEYSRLAKDLSIRSDEVINIRQQIENLEQQKNTR